MKMYEITNGKETLSVCVDSTMEFDPERECVSVQSYNVKYRGKISAAYVTERKIEDKQGYLSFLFRRKDGATARKYIKGMFPGYKITKCVI